MIDGTYILAACFAFLFLLCVWAYFDWERWDHYRRHERLVHRNLQKMGGRK